MFNIEFAYPWVLLALVLMPALVVLYIYRQRKGYTYLVVSFLSQAGKAPDTARPLARHSLFVLRMIAVACLIIILARPQSSQSWKNVTTEGIDIVIALDISGSMLAQDFRPDRLEAAKSVATEFITGRPDDRIGLIVFSGESFTQCPLTSDHTSLINLMQNVQSGMITDGTAIGDGLATAVNRLKDSKAKSKVIILLTDGENNQGAVAPTTAADIAKTFDIRVYTIGVGRRGTAPYPVQTPFGIQFEDRPVNIDEPLLQEISSLTGALYFRATSNQKLKEIYTQIDKLEKTRIEVSEHHKRDEQYLGFGLLALLVLGMELTGRFTWLRSIP